MPPANGRYFMLAILVCISLAATPVCATAAQTPSALPRTTLPFDIVAKLADVLRAFDALLTKERASPLPEYVAASGNGSGSGRIDQLTSTAINTPTITGGSISGANVSGYLPLAGGTLSGALAGTDMTLSGVLTAGTLSVSGISSAGAVFAPYFTATSTTASQLPYASSTALTVSGSGFFGALSSINATSTSLFATTASSTHLFAATASLGVLTAGTLSLTAATTSSLAITSIPWALLSTDGAGNVVATSSPTALSFTATGANATSTFAGSLNVGSGGLLYDPTGYYGTPKVTIGKSAPASFGINVTDTSGFRIDRYGSPWGPEIRFGSAWGSIESPATTTAGQYIGSLGFETWSGTNGFLSGATINAIANDNTTATTSSANLTFSTVPLGSTGLLERMRISSAGNIGIGQTSPTYKLDVTGAGHFNSLVDAASFVATSSTATSTFAGYLTVGGSAPVVLQSNNLMVGTTSAVSDFMGSSHSGIRVTNAGGTAALMLESYRDTSNHSKVLGFGARGTAASPLTLQANDTPFEIDGFGYDGTQFRNVAQMYLRVDGPVSLGSVPTGFYFRTSGTVDRLDVNGVTGNVGVGTTTPWGNLSVQALDNSAMPQLVIGSSTATSLVVSNSGNVGVGTTNPAGAMLQVTRDQNAGTKIRVNNATVGTGAFSQLGVGSDATNFNAYAFSSGYATSSQYIPSGTLLEGSGPASGGFGLSAVNGGMLFYTNNGNERMRISQNGNVGIGTTNPAYLLDVNGAGHFAGIVDAANFVATSSTATSTFAGGLIGPGNFYVQSGSGTVGLGVQPPDQQFRLYVQANQAAGRSGIRIFSNPNNRLIVFADESDALQYGGIMLQPTGNIKFYGNGTNDLELSATYGLETLRLSSSGKVGIGTSTPTAQLSTTGTVRFSNFGAGTLTTDASGNLSVSSDERLKTIDNSYSRGLADIVKLSPILYHWNATSGLDTTSQYAGFSAQNVQSAIPEAVGQDGRGFLTLQDRPLIATAVNAIKELAQKIDGFADRFATKELSFDRAQGRQLCLTDDGGTSCYTRSQIDAALAIVGQQPSAPSSSSKNDPAPAAITINGANPAVLAIGSAYADLGATIVGPQEDLNLGIATFLNGVKVAAIQLDTSATSTSTIDYVVTDQFGTTATATRTVIVQ